MSKITEAEVRETALLARLELAPDEVARLTGELDAILGYMETLNRLDVSGVEPTTAGVPIGLKDLFVTRGVETTAGSKILEGWVPPYDGTAVAKLRAAGAILVGKLSMDEFAMGSSNENSAYGPVRNPWDPLRVPGGSSGGSAAAVAAGVCAAALGTDTGGSIRQPAALCGVTGIN